MTIFRKIAKIVKIRKFILVIIFVICPQKWQFRLENESFGISRNSAYLNIENISRSFWVKYRSKSHSRSILELTNNSFNTRAHEEHCIFCNLNMFRFFHRWFSSNSTILISHWLDRSQGCKMDCEKLRICEIANCDCEQNRNFATVTIHFSECRSQSQHNALWFSRRSQLRKLRRLLY